MRILSNQIVAEGDGEIVDRVIVRDPAVLRRKRQGVALIDRLGGRGIDVVVANTIPDEPEDGRTRMVLSSKLKVVR